MFVTAWMGILELSTGHLAYVNAGHNPPLLRRADGKYDYLRTRSGLVLAGMEETRYRSCSLELSPGDALFIYTDGVTEATDASGQRSATRRRSKCQPRLCARAAAVCRQSRCRSICGAGTAV